MRARGGGHGVLDRDPTGLVVLEQRLVEGLHAVVLALGDDLAQAVGLVGVEDHVVRAAGHPEDLAHRDTALAVGRADESL